MRYGAEVAVVGAGMAGLACAKRLTMAGCAVTVFEKSHGPGGRAATRITELGSFDHGAQYLSARDEAFVEALAPLKRGGVVAPWQPRVVADEASSEGVHSPWLVGVPSMRAIGEALAEGLKVRYEERVTRLERVNVARSGRWALKRVDADEMEGAIEVTEGLFDAVVVALPTTQSIDLLRVAPALAMRARQPHMNPCWALMLGFAEPLATPFDVLRPHHARLSWIARDSSKPGRRPGERWVAHGSAAWSEEHFNDDPEDVKAKLLKAFHEVTGSALQPVHAALHRWRYALVTQSLEDDFLWDDQLAIGACGDWCKGARLEAAWLSGHALACAMLA